MYKLTNGGAVIRLSDNASIPPDTRNNDYSAYLAWVAANNTPEPADPAPPLDGRQEILSVSQQALASGFLHIIMFDLMQRYLAQAQAIVPTVTEADLLDVNGPYYSKPYADTRTYYLQLVALQDAK